MKTSKRGNVRRGSIEESSGNTELVDTDFPDAQILGAAAMGRWFRFAGIVRCFGKRHGGKGHREVATATGEGNPLKAKAQGRYPHETRREGLRVEQSVRRLTKPEGVAQPGVVSPVLVAACFLKRRRVGNPMEGSSKRCVSLAISWCDGRPARVDL